MNNIGGMILLASKVSEAMWGHKRARYAFKNSTSIATIGSGCTPSYILHTRAFRIYLMGGDLHCKNDYKVIAFYM